MQHLSFLHSLEVAQTFVVEEPKIMLKGTKVIRGGGEIFRVITCFFYVWRRPTRGVEIKVKLSPVGAGSLAEL